MSEFEMPPVPEGPIESPPPYFAPHAVQLRVVLETLAEAGIELGAFERGTAEWLSRWDWPTVAVIASWVQRARVAGTGREWAVRVAEADGEGVTFDVRATRELAEEALSRWRPTHPADVTTTAARKALLAALTGDGALDKQTAAELVRQYMVVITADRRERLVHAESDLLDIRGALAPNGRPRRVPMELGEHVAPAVEWLLGRITELERRPTRAEAARLREELERQTALAEQGARANRELSRLRRELGEMREREAAAHDQLAAAVGRASSAVWPDLIAAVTKLAARPTRAAVLREAAQVLEDSEHLLAADELREMAAEAGKVTGRPAGGITRPTPLRWGLDDMELGDDGSVTLMLPGPGGEPYVLDLAPERAMALGLPITEHAAPYTQATTDPSDDDAATRHCGHDDYHDGHPWHDRPHTWCPGTNEGVERGEGRG